MLTILRYTRANFSYHTKGSNPTRLHGIALLSVCISAGIFATTIQAQDFKDEDGDRKIGRQTIPIVFSATISRCTLILPLIIWSIGLSYTWKLDWFATVLFNSLALVVSTRFWKAHTVYQTQVAFYWYNVRHRFPLIALSKVNYRHGCRWRMRCQDTTTFII